ncbi:unnamed protein product, partial [Linum tenue]
LLGRIYYTDPNSPKPGSLLPNVTAVVNGVALCGTLVRELFFGWLDDKLGHKKVYGMTLAIMVFSSIASGLSFARNPAGVIATLCFFCFWLGFGIGDDYPLSATIMSEYANKKTRRIHRCSIRNARIRHPVRGNRRPDRLHRVRSRAQHATVLRQQSSVASPAGRLRLADNSHGQSHPGRADLLLADEDARNRPLHGAGGQQREAGEGGHGQRGQGRESQSHHRGFRRQIRVVYPRIPQAPWASLIGDDVHVVPPRHCLLQPEFVPEGHLHRHPLDPAGGNNERDPRGFQGGACTDDHRAVRDGTGVIEDVTNRTEK